MGLDVVERLCGQKEEMRVGEVWWKRGELQDVRVPEASVTSHEEGATGQRVHERAMPLRPSQLIIPGGDPD